MGKNIISQRRGKGSLTYRANSHKFLTKLRYPIFEEPTEGTVIDFADDPGRDAPLAVVKLTNGEQHYFLASEGIQTGDTIQIGPEAAIKVGNVLPIGKVPEGTPVFNMELRPKDGGKMLKTSGTYGLVVSHGPGKTVVKMPSKVFKDFKDDCMVTVGIAGGGERVAKPLVKAGAKFHKMHARGRLYPRTSARAMNAVDHKFGGSHMGVGKTTSRHAPAGRKVGSIAAKKSGKRK